MNLGVFSNEKLDPWVNWTTLGPPLLKPLAANKNARLIAPPRVRAHGFRAWSSVLHDVRLSDTLFWMQAASHPEVPIHIASLLHARVRRSAFVIDAWKHLLTKIGTLAVLQRLDPCFVAFREGYEELRRRFPQGRFEWLPFGVDTGVFDSVPGERPVFAYWMGRRYEPLHHAMLRYCSDRGLDYRYTLRSGEFPNPSDLGHLVGSCQYFLVGPPDLPNPERTGGFSPFVMRYLEGLSAGARLLGVLPRSREYEKLLPLDAILTVAPDGSDLPSKLDADRKNPTIRSAVEHARTLVRERHSWTKRAEQIFRLLSTGEPTGFDQEVSPFRDRQDYLAA
jgi:Glycosyl transferases group 1